MNMAVYSYETLINRLAFYLFMVRRDGVMFESTRQTIDNDLRAVEETVREWRGKNI